MGMDHPIMQCKALSLLETPCMEAHGSAGSPHPSQVIHLPEVLLVLWKLRIFCPWRGAHPGTQLLPKPSQPALPATPTSLLLAREDPRGANTGDKCTAGTSQKPMGLKDGSLNKKQ